MRACPYGIHFLWAHLQQDLPDLSMLSFVRTAAELYSVPNDIVGYTH